MKFRYAVVFLSEDWFCRSQGVFKGRLGINLFMKSQITINLTCDFQDIVLYLLENGADIDMFNNHNNTPFFLATESLQKEICQVAKNIQQLYY